MFFRPGRNDETALTGDPTDIIGRRFIANKPFVSRQRFRGQRWCSAFAAADLTQPELDVRYCPEMRRADGPARNRPGFRPDLLLLQPRVCPLGWISGNNMVQNLTISGTNSIPLIHTSRSRFSSTGT